MLLLLILQFYKNITCMERLIQSYFTNKIFYYCKKIFCSIKKTSIFAALYYAQITTATSLCAVYAAAL